MPVRSFMGLFGKGAAQALHPTNPLQAASQVVFSNCTVWPNGGGGGGAGNVIQSSTFNQNVLSIRGYGGGIQGGVFSPGTLGVSVGSQQYAPRPQPTEFDFFLDDKKLMTIKADGTIIKGEGFTTEDEMSIKFWEVIMEAFPIAWWKGLVKRR